MWKPQGKLFTIYNPFITVCYCSHHYHLIKKIQYNVVILIVLLPFLAVNFTSTAVVRCSAAESLAKYTLPATVGRSGTKKVQPSGVAHPVC